MHWFGPPERHTLLKGLGKHGVVAVLLFGTINERWALAVRIVGRRVVLDFVDAVTGTWTYALAAKALERSILRKTAGFSLKNKFLTKVLDDDAGLALHINPREVSRLSFWTGVPVMHTMLRGMRADLIPREVKKGLKLLTRLERITAVKRKPFSKFGLTFQVRKRHLALHWRWQLTRLGMKLFKPVRYEY